MDALVLLVFSFVYLGMALGRWPGLMLDRTGVALVGAIVLYATASIDGAGVRTAIDVPTLVVLFGLMVLSAQLALSGFYDWCATRLCSAPVGPAALLALVIVVGGILASVLANDVVVYAMTPMLCRGLMARGLDPRPHVIALACAANAGSAATIIGNPQNILIAQAGGLDFWRFFAVCGPASAFSLGAVYVVIRLGWRRNLVERGAVESPAMDQPLDRGALAKGALATAALLVLFTTPLPQVSGVLVIAGVLLISRRLATRRMLGLVDWHLLVLIASLFIVTGALTATGLPAAALQALAQAGIDLGAPGVLATLALAGSNTVGNVPLVVLLLASLPGADEAFLTALALLSTLAGNLLVVGSLANIITLERAAEAGVGISFRDHAVSGVPVTAASFAFALGWLWLFPRLFG